MFNISEEDCLNCYSEIFEVISSALINVPKEKIIIIGKHQDKSKLRAFANNNIKQDIFVYNYKQKLSLPIQKAEIPFVFILNKNKKATFVYGFNEMNIKGMESYMKMVINKFNLSEQ